ncbi:MAG: DUF2207 domain-containing protein, partial [Candidatus Omnitrophica bacterium]|nr:DUF2207 domain-containing protein [Candidatus Omnitrophota bacterium]
MLKRGWIVTVFCLCVACGPAQAWVIEDYNIEITLQKDSTFIVREKIAVDFGYESKHGIYRDIPTVYKDENGRPYDIRFDVLSVEDENRHPWEYTEENGENFKRIKIGSPYRTLSGQQSYVVAYQVRGAVLFLDDHDELYWNAVGSRWDVNIQHVFVSVLLPEAVPKEEIRLAAYTGVGGSRLSNARSSVVHEKLITLEGDHYAPYEGFTIVAGLPKGILTPPPVTYPPDSSPAPPVTY